jgi:hypothetical protein
VNERVADPVDRVGSVSLSGERSVRAIESHAPRAEEKEDREALLDYTPVLPRNTQTLVVRFRPGARLTPLPYSLDEENP